MEIELAAITEGAHQVRAVSVDEELQELAQSIMEHGLLQPVKVRPTDHGYELVYGHRRVAAMRLLGWTKCEAIVDSTDNEDSLVQSLVENLQRQDLDILEEAHSYQTLRDRGCTLTEIAELVKKPKGRISNRLSILQLPSPVQTLVRPRTGPHTTTTEHGGLSPDSASRIASAVETPGEAMALARKAIDERLSSREIRQLTGLLKETSASHRREQIIRTSWDATAKESEPARREASVRAYTTPRSTEPLSALVHRRIVWNLHRMDVGLFDHFTIGYASRSVSQLIELLQLADVQLVADVRHVPVSQFRPEFSRSNLQEALSAEGIRYAHWRDLGVPSEVRRAYREAADSRDLFSWYDLHVEPELKLTQHADELSNQRVALMCVEVDPQSCHRHRIATCLERLGYALLDL